MHWLHNPTLLTGKILAVDSTFIPAGSEGDFNFSFAVLKKTLF